MLRSRTAGHDPHEAQGQGADLRLPTSSSTSVFRVTRRRVSRYRQSAAIR